MKKIFSKSLILIVISVVSLIGCSKKENILKIGIIQPITGELANFGQTVINGIQLAVAENEDSLSQGKIKLIIEDSKGEPTQAVNAFNKLINVDKVDFVIGSLTSGATLAISPISQENKKLLISPTASNPKLSEAGRYFFRVWPSDNYDGEVAAKYCIEELDAMKASIVYINNDYGVGLKDVFTSTFNSLGGQVVSVDSYLPDNLNFRTLITKIKTENVDLVYIPGHPLGIASFLKQSKELGLVALFFSNVSAEDKEFIADAREAAVGLFFVTPAFDLNSNRQEVSNFVNSYRKAYNGESPDIHAVKGYEAMFVLIQGFKEGKKTPDEMVNFLLSNSFNTISGLLEFNESGDVITDMAIKKYDENLKVDILNLVREK